MTASAEGAKGRQQRLRSQIHALIVSAKEVPCARCGHVYPSVCMDFDHLPGFEKTINIGSPKNWTSVSRIKAEITKCQVLCSNCHRIVTWERKYERPCPEPTWYTPEAAKLRFCELFCLRVSNQARKIRESTSKRLTRANEWGRV